MRAEAVPVRESGHELVDLPQLARTFARYKWGIAGLTVLAAVLAGLVAFSLRPMYRGTVTLLIEGQGQRVAQLQDVYDSELPEFQYLGSQIAILKSREVAGHVVDRLALLDSAEFNETDKRDSWASKLDVRRYLPLIGADAPLEEPPTPEQRRESILDEFANRLTVEAFGRTQVLKVHFDAHDPELAADIANTIAEILIESGLQARLDATTKATVWLTDKLSEIQSNLAAAESALQKFREQQQLVVVGSARSLTEDEVVDYSRRLREAQRKRTELQNVYEKVRQAGSDTRRLRNISGLLIDPIVQRANESFLSAQETMKQLEERYGSKHPAMEQARARLSTAETALNEQLRIAAQGTKTEYEIALESERALARQVESARTQIRNLDRKDFELSALERDVTTYRELYNAFLTRFKETDVAGSYQSVNARVIDPAVKPRTALSPNKKEIVLVAALCGLLAGILLAIVHYVLNEGIESAEDLEAVAQLPVFGVLPLVSGFAGRRSNLVKYFLDKPRTSFGEGVRSVGAALRLSDSERAIKRIMVTSSVPKEGKSSVSAALALTLAGTERVLLIEADLRRPTLRRLFNLGSQGPGLTEVVLGEQPLDSCLRQHEEGAVWILPAGRMPSNPAELLGSDAFSKLLAELSARFDRIILDSPPAQAAADALMLGRQCDGVLFVVKSDATTRRAVKSSLKQLRFASCPLLGLVVNQVDVHRNPHYGESYNYMYGYYG